MQLSIKHAAFAAASVLLAFAAFKAYQPAQSQNSNTVHNTPPASNPVQATTDTTDINSASLEELMKLPGINEDIAQRIISGRPYGSKMWLVSDNVITENEFQQIRGQLVAKHTPETIEILRKRANATEQAR